MNRKDIAVGDWLCTPKNLCPSMEADCLVVVITHDEFSKGEPVTKARYHWPLPDIQKAVFVMFLNGKCAGKVSMYSPNDLKKNKHFC